MHIPQSSRSCREVAKQSPWLRCSLATEKAPETPSKITSVSLQAGEFTARLWGTQLSCVINHFTAAAVTR